MRKIPPLILFILCVGFFGWKFLHATIDSVDVLTIDSSTTNGPTFTTATDRYGSSVANIGDLNDDGVEDIAVGAPYDSTGGTERGSVHIHFMNLDGSIDSTVKLTGATTNGATLIDADRYGTSVVGLGDLNADGVEDIAVGAPNNFGGVYIHFMNTNGTIDSTVKIGNATLNGPGVVTNLEYGGGLENIGDLNGDGVIDLMVGSHSDSENGSFRGAAYIHFMNTDGSLDSTVKINDSTVNGPTLPNSSTYGEEISTVGDLNNDGVVEIAVSARGDTENGTGRGAIYVHFMNTDGSLDSTVKINDSTTNGPTLANGDSYGSAIEGMGDLNNDGVEDILVGAFGSSSGRGGAFLHFMNTDGSVYRTNEITCCNQTGFTVPSSASYGSGIANIGDYNSDGTDDIAVGAMSINKVYLHYLDIIPDVTVTESGGTTAVSEAGLTDTISLNLDLIVPTDDVTVTLVPDVELSLDDTTLVFTPLNWTTPQSVTVSAVDDLQVEGAHTGYITYVFSSNDPNYDGLVLGSNDVSVADNDTGVISSVLIDYGGFAQVDEDGNVNFVEVVLTSEPTDDVIVTISPDSQLTSDVVTMTFTALDWSSPQTFTLGAVDDLLIEGNHTGLITYSVSSADVDYGSIIVPDASFNIGDNDFGVVVTESSSNTAVVEGGATDSIEVALAVLPTDDVTVTLAPDSQITLSSTTLTFTTANWATAQTVTVTAVDDTSVEGSHTGEIGFTASSTDVNFNAIAISDLIVDITDNDSTPAVSSSSTSSSGFLMPHIRLKDKAKETTSRFVDLQAIAPYTVVFYEISNTPDFANKEVYQREYTERDLYWDICKGLKSCVKGEKYIYARFYTSQNLVIDSTVTIDYMPEMECPYFKGYLRKGSRTNDPEEVKKAQDFLNREMGVTLAIDGIFGIKTDRAVRDFQDKYPEEILFPWQNLKKSTGWWYITTSAYANILMGC